MQGDLELSLHTDR